MAIIIAGYIHHKYSHSCRDLTWMCYSQAQRQWMIRSMKCCCRDQWDITRISQHDKCLRQLCYGWLAVSNNICDRSFGLIEGNIIFDTPKVARGAQKSNGREEMSWIRSAPYPGSIFRCAVYARLQPIECACWSRVAIVSGRDSSLVPLHGSRVWILGSVFWNNYCECTIKV